MGGKNSTVSTTDPKLGTLRVQTSMVGLTIPLLWGQPRVTGNLTWFGGFRSEAVVERTTSGGKGGGGGVTQERVTYRYFADAIMALAAGPHLGVASAWKGKRRVAGQTAAGAINARTHTATVPVGGVVTVPITGGATFLQDTSVVTPDNGTYLETGDASSIFQANILRPTIDYTRSGAAYTFNGAYVGVNVTISYTEQTAGTWASALAQLGMEFASGAIGQPVWSYLQTNYPAQALAYSGTAYLRAVKYELTSGAELENHSFEVVTPYQVGGGVVDAWAHDVVSTYLTHPHWGLGWKSSRLNLTEFTTYCRALPLYISPALTKQRAAREELQDLADLANCMWIWEGGVLRLQPRQDAAISSSFGSYTPNTAPEFDLEYVDGTNGFLLEPVEVEPSDNAQVKNIMRAQWTNRANNYNEDLMDASDAAHIQLFGERPSDVRSALAVHDPQVMQRLLQRWLQREVTVLNKYRFAVPYARCLMQLGSLQTLTDSTNGLLRRPVRITKRRERGNNRYEYEAEDAPIGSASAPLYGQQAGSGFVHDFNTPPATAITPVVFEMHPYSSSTGLEVAVAVTGPSGGNWSGCTVWASIDGGTTYEKWGAIEGGSRMGTITAALSAAGTSVPVLLAGKGGELLAGSANAADTNQTLCWIGNASGGEFVTYEGSTFTVSNAYTLSGLRRARLDNNALAWASGSSFVRVDDDSRIARSGSLEASMVGKVISIKVTSRNVYNGAEQSLADVSAVTYTITGYQRNLPPPPPTSYTVTQNADGSRRHTIVLPALLPRDYKGVRFAYNFGATAVPWASQFLVTAELFPVSADQAGQTIFFDTPGPGAGVASFRVRGVDEWGNQSSTEAVAANVTLGAPPAAWRSARNYVKNGGFELDLKYWTPQGFGGASAGSVAIATAPNPIYRGLKSLILLIPAGSPAGWQLQNYQDLKTSEGNNLQPSTSYLFSVRQATDFVTGKHSTGHYLASVVGAAETPLAATAIATGFAGHYILAFTTPATFDAIRVRLVATSVASHPSAAAVFLDDVLVEEISAGVALADARPGEWQDAVPGPSDVDTPQIAPGANFDTLDTKPADTSNTQVSNAGTGAISSTTLVASLTYANNTGFPVRLTASWYAALTGYVENAGGGRISSATAWIEVVGTSYTGQPQETRNFSADPTGVAIQNFVGEFSGTLDIAVAVGETVTVNYRDRLKCPFNAGVGTQASITRKSPALMLRAHKRSG